jgi:hypothetical protein
LHGAGEEEVGTFDNAGYARLYCNAHLCMIGHILVLDTPYFARPDATGHFQPPVPGSRHGS